MGAKADVTSVSVVPVGSEASRMLLGAADSEVLALDRVSAGDVGLGLGEAGKAGVSEVDKAVTPVQL